MTACHARAYKFCLVSVCVQLVEHNCALAQASTGLNQSTQSAPIASHAHTSGRVSMAIVRFCSARVRALARFVTHVALVAGVVVVRHYFLFSFSSHVFGGRESVHTHSSRDKTRDTLWRFWVQPIVVLCARACVRAR